MKASLKVWFQNRRAKWKKRKKTTNVFRTPGALLPSHGLPPFGAMSDGLCSPGMFTGDSRWGVSSMAPGLGQLSQGGVSMGSFGQSIGQLNQGSPLASGLNSGLPIASSMASNGSTVYQAHYGLNTLDPVFYGHEGNDALN
ncbi:homeobox protein orthopedia-like [Schistocerca cancellata]|uniref:homeobox protein orthopedia-like n=1 Tax=Schistocerca cancellata TaxID=274614 RepID=UPI00211799D1|nr:homeobox protein orthopedia-like [Schistocerca cancellata]